MSKDIIKVEQPNLVAFVEKIQELILEGYVVCKTNSGVPSTWGPGLYTCEVEKNVAEEVKTEPKEVEKQPEEVQDSAEQSPAVEDSEAETEEAPKTRTTKRTRKTSK